MYTHTITYVGAKNLLPGEGRQFQKKCVSKNFAYDYRYGFNGQEKTNEIAGVGNHNTAMFWEYDTRLGRRWNTDPVVKPHESPYLTFSGNPIVYSDVHGDNGKIEVQKGAEGQNHQATVTLKVAYNKNDKRTSGQVKDLQSNDPEVSGTGITNPTTKVHTLEVDGVNVDVTFKYEFVAMESDDDVRKAVRGDVNGFTEGLLSNTNLPLGASEEGDGVIETNVYPADDINHELGHAVGLNHAVTHIESPYFTHRASPRFQNDPIPNGSLATGFGFDGDQCEGPITAGFMSYAKNRMVQSYEVRRVVESAMRQCIADGFSKQKYVFSIKSAHNGGATKLVDSSN